MVRNEFLKRDLIDIFPSPVCPTWDNGRCEEAYIAKRLDRFLIHASLTDILGMPFSSVDNSLISDHRPILMGWTSMGFNKGFPFKFNRQCLGDLEFRDIVVKAWRDYESSGTVSHQEYFLNKMINIRKVVKNWQKLKRSADRREFMDILAQLQKLTDSSDYNSLSFEKRQLVKDLHKKKMKFLKKEEIYWRLKSRAVWMKEGDKNSKFSRGTLTPEG